MFLCDVEPVSELILVTRLQFGLLAFHLNLLRCFRLTRVTLGKCRYSSLGGLVVVVYPVAIRQDEISTKIVACSLENGNCLRGRCDLLGFMISTSLSSIPRPAG
jgi:hypothetical protein